MDMEAPRVRAVPLTCTMILARIWKSDKSIIPFFNVFDAHATDSYENMKANGSILTQMEGNALACCHEASTHTNDEAQLQTL